MGTHAYQGALGESFLAAGASLPLDDMGDESGIRESSGRTGGAAHVDNDSVQPFKRDDPLGLILSTGPDQQSLQQKHDARLARTANESSGRSEDVRTPPAVASPAASRALPTVEEMQLFSIVSDDPDPDPDLDVKASVSSLGQHIAKGWMSRSRNAEAVTSGPGTHRAAAASFIPSAGEGPSRGAGDSAKSVESFTAGGGGGGAAYVHHARGIPSWTDGTAPAPPTWQLPEASFARDKEASRDLLAVRLGLFK